ncbi:MAG: hypothetical protein LBB85_11725 [Dysgonamonadaceae bacterium]|jgi:hypothetical protein|nr:hypothetical protein [Dysgonamonadaceae bacterium]
METKVSHARFYTLLKQIPQANKEDWVWQYSNLRTTSLSEFYESDPQGYNRMIQQMQSLVNELIGRQSCSPEIAELKHLRSTILHRLQKYGIDTTDWSRVNAFMRQPRVAGKTLGEMTVDELRNFIPKMSSILSKQDKIRQEIQCIAFLN